MLAVKAPKMAMENTSDNNTERKNSTPGTRLPCRGCTVKCKNYDMCDSTLWRMTAPYRVNKYENSSLTTTQ